MPKKTPSAPGANSSNATPPPDQMGFVTANKLPDFNPNFAPDSDPQNDAKKRSTQSIWKRSKKPASGDRVYTSFETTPKEVHNRSKKPASADPEKVQKKSKKTTKEKRSIQSIWKPASADPEKVQKTTTPPITKKEVPNQSTLPNPSKPDNEVQKHLEQYKRSIHSHDIDTVYLSIIYLLKNGLRPSVIAAKSGVNKTTVQRHLTALKKQGLVLKVGYGVWEVIDSPESTKKRSTQSIYVAKNTPPSEVRQNLHMFIPDSVRAHAFLFTLQVPKGLTNWNNEKRELYLERHQIPFKTLGIIGGGQRLIINGRITHLTNNSIVIYDRSSYFAEKAIEAKSNAVHSFISIVKKLERTLHADLTSGSDYKFRVSRQHYALVKNALAQQYNADGERLEIRSEGDNSLWFLIDNSFNLDEAEAVHPKTGMTDIEKVQKFFNGVKETGITPTFILEAMGGIQGSQIAIQQSQAAYVELHATYAENTTSHLELITNINAAVQDLTAAVQDLTKAAKNGANKP